MRHLLKIYFLVIGMGLFLSCAEKNPQNPSPNPNARQNTPSSVLREEIEVDPSEVDLSSLGTFDSEGLLSQLPQRKPFPFIYSTILLRSKSSTPYLIQIDFEGYLENEIQHFEQQWQEDVLERTIVGDVERWSKAPVILEVKELKENGELGIPETKNFSNGANGKIAYLLKKELVLIFKTEALFREFPWMSRAVNFDLRVDQVRLQGDLKILSAPYDNFQNWADITPKDPFPLLKIVSK